MHNKKPAVNKQTVICTEMPKRLTIIVSVIILILTGCTTGPRKPTQLCPGTKSITNSLSLLESHLENTISLTANGQCILRYYTDGKLHKENFPVKLWINPPTQIRLQGDVAFDPKGIVLGLNKNEFWLSIKPKKISCYWWGQRSEVNCIENLKISPYILLEAFGGTEIGKESNWSLSNKAGFDVLTKQNGKGDIVKKIYLNRCDYLIRKIEYFDVNNELWDTIEMDKYQRVSENVFVPAVIKNINHITADSKGKTSITLTLKSIKPTEFTEKQQNYLFTRPRPERFKHIYKIIDGKMIEQLQ